MYLKIYVQLSLDIMHEYIFVSISKKHNLTSQLIYLFKLVNIYAGGSEMEVCNASCETLAATVRQKFQPAVPLSHTLMANCQHIWMEPNVTVCQSSYQAWILENCLASQCYQLALEL